MNGKQDDDEADLMLIKEIKNEPAKFAELYERYYQRLFNFFLFLTQHFQDSEDLTSETFLRVLLNLEKFKWKSSFRTWLFKIAKHTHLEQIAKTKHEIPWDEDLVIQAPDNVAKEVERKMDVERILRKISTLSFAQAEVLSYYLIAQLTVDEIATVTNKSVRAIRMLMLRGIRNLRDQMNDRPQNPKESDHE